MTGATTTPVIAGAAKNGIRVLPTVYSSPTWAEPSPEYPPLGARLPEFEDFARAAVRRYGSDGSFWKANPGIAQAADHATGSSGTSRTRRSSGSRRRMRATTSSCCADSTPRSAGADPAAQIMLGGLFPTPRGGIDMADFISALYRGGGKGLFDAAAMHPYAATPSDALASVREARSVLDRLGDPGARLWITEVGWASAGQPSGLTVGPQRQADYLTRIFELAAQHRERLGLDGVIWYSLNDTPGPLWPGHCGLFTLDGPPKPSWDAFVRLTGGTT